MKTTLLLPAKFKTIGWYILIPSTIFGIALAFTGFSAWTINAKVFAIISGDILSPNKYFTFIDTGITNTLVAVLFITGTMLVGFSREKTEDEYISNLRLSSLLWAVLVNYTLLFLAFVFIYGTAFLSVMVYNIFTVLAIFIARFNYVLYKNSKTGTDEK